MCSPGSNFLLLGAGWLAFFIIWFGFHGFGGLQLGSRSPRKISWIGVGNFWLPSFALASQPASTSGRAPSWPCARLPCQGNSSIRRHVLDVLRQVRKVAVQAVILDDLRQGFQTLEIDIDLAQEFIPPMIVVSENTVFIEKHRPPHVAE